MITDADLKKLKTALIPEFKQLDTKFEQLNSKIDGVKTRLDVLEDNVKDDFKQINQKLDEVKIRLDVLEDNVTGDIAKLQNENLVTSNYKRDLDNHEERISTIETKLAIIP